MSHLCGICSTAFYTLHDLLIYEPIMAFPTETGHYILDTDANNFGLNGVLSQIQGDVECVVAHCSCALQPSQRRYCTTKREMLAAVCIQFRLYRRGSKFTLHMDYKSLVWLQEYGRYDGLVVACSTTVPVFHSAPVGPGSR